MATGTPVVGTVSKRTQTLPTLRTHRYRRIYCGAHFWGDCRYTIWGAKIRFILDSKVVGALDFGWRQDPYYLPSNPDLEYAPTATNYPIVPPYSVESVPSGSSIAFFSAAPAQADEMIVQSMDFQQTTIRNIRMLPVPVVADCDQIAVEFVTLAAKARDAIQAYINARDRN